MHAAPPVRMSLAADPGWYAFVTACAAGAAANLAAWLAAQAQQSTAVIGTATLISAALAAGLAWRALRRNTASSGVLAWDGVVWRWAPTQALPGPSQAGELAVMVDLGAWILLRFAPGAPGQAVAWLPVSRRQAKASWPLWRTALLSRRPGRDPLAVADRS